MDEAIKSIKAFLYDRTVSPLFGAFITSWVVCNYRMIIAVLDSDATLTEKMAFIDHHFDVVSYQLFDYSFHMSGQFFYGLIYPALLTVFYIFGYPKLAKPVYEYSLERQKELRNLKLQNDEARLLSPAESRKLIKEIEQIRQRADEETKEYSKKITSLTETINSLESTQKVSLESSKNESTEDERNQTEKFDIGEFKKFVIQKVDALQNVEFELSDLFEKEAWDKLSVATRKNYGKLFKAFVDDKIVNDVEINRKGSGNQQIYRKNSNLSQSAAIEFKNILNYWRFLPSNISENKREELLRKLTSYCLKNNISKEMLDVLVPLVAKDGTTSLSVLYNELKNERSSIETDHLITMLGNKKLVFVDAEDDVVFTDQGKEFAVESGLAEIARLSRPFREF